MQEQLSQLNIDNELKGGRMKARYAIKSFFWLIAFFISSSSYAAIQLNNTRVIINEEKNFGTVRAKNVTTEPFVIQSWIEGTEGEMETPFFVTPPLNRMDGGEEFSLTIRKLDGKLPEDKESYFWLNVLEIPKTDNSVQNTLSFAVRTRVKVFYRPKGIGRPADIDKVLNWEVKREGGKCQLLVKNTSPFIVNFADVKINDKLLETAKGFMAMPFSEQSLDLSSCDVIGNLQARFINDYGAVINLPIVKIN
ncbi:fimbrial biogenesis chaperone [Alcaligenes endophyticus]|uniref:Molecular chaperone n=1 Tax=Alcaligenes endophyticus TaxID=1929088 RepID=A0ABT8EFI6_9BURK|nr:molecular chaperone [Alcaligenes endophyticus]MCX5590293.1 molecular chaperone [Alcaligenes endophyticus]MDN4120043.1 molecular chaperone [Alcaligenes endophyticus]